MIVSDSVTVSVDMTYLIFLLFQCRIEEDIAPGLRVWRRALSAARSAAQVALCIQQLQKSIAWEKSIMKAVSVFT